MGIEDDIEDLKRRVSYLEGISTININQVGVGMNVYCPLCAIDLSKNTMYVCHRFDCPSQTRVTC